MSEATQSLQLGAIVCGHIARDGLPILCAYRAEKQDPADSGWQFLCYSGQDELMEDAQIWALKDVVEKEPSLSEFMNVTVGTRLVRSDASSPWSVQE